MTPAPMHRTSPSPHPITRAVGRLKEALDLSYPLRILVLFDPDALLCEELRALGYEVGCCPDFQRGWEREVKHTRVVAQSTEELVTGHEHWDVVVGSQGWDRHLAVHAEARIQRLLDWVRQHSSVGLFDSPRMPLAPDLNQQGPYRTHELFGEFRFLGEVHSCDPWEETYQAPLIAVSDDYLVSASFLVAAREIDRIENDALWQAGDSRTRTFFTHDERIIKVEATSEDYFERSQVAGEALFLQGVDSHVRKVLSLPRVLCFDRGLSVVSLVRESVSGAPLRSLDGADPSPILREILNEAARFAEQGLFPNDLRPWNILWNGRECRFIDFADTSWSDEDVAGLPQVLALAGTLALAMAPGIDKRDDFAPLVLRWAAECGISSADLYDHAWRCVPALPRRWRLDPSLASRTLFESVIQQVLESAPVRGPMS